MSAYAKALFATNTTLTDELEACEELFTKRPDLFQYFTSPANDKAIKDKIVLKAFQNHPELLNFLRLLIKRGQFSNFHEIVRSYKKLADQKLGILSGELATPSPLDDSSKEKITKEWEAYFKKKIVLKSRIDPSLLGGGVLTIDDKRIDFSLKDKLNKLKTTLVRG